MEPTPWTALGPLCIELACDLQRPGVHGDDAVQHGAVIVVGGDAVEVHLHERGTREDASLERRLDVCDGRLFQSEHGGRTPGVLRHESADHGQNQDEDGG